MRTLIAIGSGLTLGLVAAQGCSILVLDPLHCANNDGDAYCAEQFPDESRPFCERGTRECGSDHADKGCVAAKPADECYSPCGGRSTVKEDDECVMEEPPTGSSSGEVATDETSNGSGSESSTTGPMPCMSDEDCPDAAAPFCEPVSGDCVACNSDAVCAALAAPRPLCVDGACVQCTSAAQQECTGETPICDDSTNACVPCTAHDQCGMAACNLFTGACLPVDAVVHVGGGGGIMPNFPSLTEAIAYFADAAEPGTIIVHQGNYDEAATVMGNDQVLAFLAADGTLPRWILGSGESPQLTVSMGATVLMDGMQLSSNADSDSPGLLVDGGRVWLDRSRIVQNSGGGIVASNAAELTLRNCFVGQDNSSRDSIAIDGSDASILYTTALGGFGSSTSALQCTNDTTVELRNSVFATLSDNPELTCTGAMISHSAAESNPGGEGSVALGGVTETMMNSWFASYPTGDFSLTEIGATSLENVAQWHTDDPRTDIDGDPRPAIDGAADYAGADIWLPEPS